MKRWLVYDFSQDASCNSGVERPVGEGGLFTTLIGMNSGFCANEAKNKTVKSKASACGLHGGWSFLVR